MELPSLPSDFNSVISYLNKSTSPSGLHESVQPYIDYETKLRQIYAQQPKHDAAKVNHIVSIFANEQLISKARNFEAETDTDKEKYLLALPDSKRHKDGVPATVTSIKEFKTNFNVFSEQSLVDLDWSNVVAAGSSVVTALLPVDEIHNQSKRALRSYYHEQLAPASDVDLFIYGLDEEQAIEKIKQIENSVRDSVLSETTTIRTKNAITIVSEYPTRHVQIVLRLYKSITEVLTGFDVDCSCVAYDGKQVWASPRALAAYATQQNSVDLTRRSPSYENRLSKYSHRGFEVYWPSIERSRVDPTIFERAFNRVVGLARLLVLEKLPHPSDRDSYADKRRKERGRPELPWNARYRHALPGNVKDAQPDDVPDWLEDENHSEYHTFTIPYGPKFSAKKIEKLLFKQDLLLNAEWNKPKDRETKLHRHPAFFGSVEDVIQDCCGFCPGPTTDEDLKAHEAESKLYISGELKFMKENPGRQAIGSFHPLTADDWTDMAYIGSSSRLCQAIVDNDLEAVKDWFTEEGADVNRRDHTGRTPLQLACMCSSPAIVQELVDRGARIVSRIYNGMTALHMAAHRGNADIIRLLLDKSEANEEEEVRKEEVRKNARRATAVSDKSIETGHVDDEDIDMVDGNDDDDKASDRDDEMTEGSFVKVKDKRIEEDNEDEPDVYDIDVLAWDSPVSALHLAIMAGHIEVIKLLIDQYGADVMLPVKLKGAYSGTQAILNLVLPLHLSSRKANESIRTLLSLGASPAQADSSQISNVHYLVHEAKIQILDILNEADGEATRKVINHLRIDGWYMSLTCDTPLLTAIRTGSPDVVRKVLELGAQYEIDFESFAKAYTQKFEHVENNSDKVREYHRTQIEQPIIEMARRHRLAEIAIEMIGDGVDVNTLTTGAHHWTYNSRIAHNQEIKSLLDVVRDRIKELEDYSGDTQNPPTKPEGLPWYYDPKVSEYESWILKTDYAQAESIYKDQIEKFENDAKSYKSRDLSGEAKKERVAKEMLIKWKALEQLMLEKGAKSYEELYPDNKKNENTYQPNYHYKPGKSGQNKDKPFENKVSFQVPDLTDSKRELYMRLFEAVYIGDEHTVKKLCLDSENPLQVAVKDSANFSPFSLAFLRGHYELAKTVLNIAAVQYQPSNKEEKTYRYSIKGADNDDNVDDEYKSDDDDSVQFVGELVDEMYAIDDIRLLSENVKSRISPEILFGWTCELWRTLPLDEPRAKACFRPDNPQRHFHAQYEDEKAPWGFFNEMWSREGRRNHFNLFRYAIINDNIEALNFLLRLQKEVFYRREDETSLQKLQLGENDFDLALQLGCTEMISEIIRATGTLLPLANLAEKSGTQLDEKPTYYQGLSVHGQKRQDWAQQDRGQRFKRNADHASPLLAAIISGNIKSVEYFLSDTPLRCYEEFTRTFEHDKHIKLLAKAEGGVERALHSWLDTRTNLAVHMAVLADPEISKPVRDFLIKRMPHFINVKSKDGITPLQLAFQYKHYDAAQELIAAGADQTTRNKSGDNLLHTIYMNRHNQEDAEALRQIVSMLDPDVARSLTLQRCFGDGAEARTPLMYFLNSYLQTDRRDNAVLEFMLKLSHEKDLEIMDGAGDYPLHALVRGNDNMMENVKYIANRRPDLLFKENATGATPLEIVENAFLRARLDSPPSVKVPQRSFGIFQGGEPLLDLSKTEPHGTTYQPQEAYDTLRELADQYPRPRSLVSLLDANETARRLAEQQQRQNEEMKQREAKGLKSYYSRRYRYGYHQREDPSNQDEVALWVNKPIRFVNKGY